MYAVLLNPESGELIAAGEVTLSRDGQTGVLEVERLHHPTQLEAAVVLKLANGEHVDVVIAETVPPTKSGRVVGYPTIWFSVGHHR